MWKKVRVGFGKAIFIRVNMAEKNTRCREVIKIGSCLDASKNRVQSANFVVSGADI